MTNRLKWSTILTKNEASQITVQAVLGETDGWNQKKVEACQFSSKKADFSV
ncbi:hypothetical protein WAX46_09135 [Bacillus sp. FJAT-53060]|uniref:hypothetical protein n=1 Tax=Bacillus TaxID=1386 RepID=UPI001CF9A900|nr:hypothetical protein [Bacillus stratosphericus]